MHTHKYMLSQFPILETEMLQVDAGFLLVGPGPQLGRWSTQIDSGMVLWLKSLPLLQQIFAYDWCLAFAVMVNITNVFLQSVIRDIALTLIFCLLYPLQATIR